MFGYIALGTVIAVAGIVGDLISSTSVSADKYADILICNARTPETMEVLNSVNRAESAAEMVRSAEAAKKSSQIAQWKLESGYISKMDALVASKNDEIKAIKTEFGYDSKLNAITEKAEKDISRLKDGMNYDSRVKELNGRIDDAKRAYDLQKNSLRIACKDDDNVFNQLKQTAKKVKTEAINNAKQSLDNLEKRFNEQKIAIESRKDADIQRLKSDFERSTDSIKAKYDKDISKLHDELNREINRVNTQAVTERSPYAVETLKKAEDLQTKADGIFAEEGRKKANIVANMSKTQKTALCLVDKGVPRPVVAIVMSIPLVLAALGIWKYITACADVLKSMGTMKEVLKG